MERTSRSLMAIRIIVVLILLFGPVRMLSAQERIIREHTGPAPFSLEAYTINDDTLHTTVIPFRARYDFFVFTRPINNSVNGYTAEGELTIEVLDSLGNSIARTIRQISLSSEDNSVPSLRHRYYQDLFTFRLPVGRYSLALLLTDKESKRKYSGEKVSFSVGGRKNILSTLIPVQSVSPSGYTMFNLGGDVIFSKDYGFVFVSRITVPRARVTLNKLYADNEEKEPVFKDSTFSIESSNNRSVEAVINNGLTLLTETVRNGYTVHYIKFNGSQLRQGRYELILAIPDSSELTVNFSARWPDMPLSLLDLDAATEPLQFITTKDEYSDLRKGGRDTRVKKFEDFWKKKDPTPETAYNEMLNEFYRRVDFSVTAFRTLKEMNGAVTDRGKIYILFGKPTTTERQLSASGAPKEIWTYLNLKRTFTFEDPGKQGNYKLTENK